MSVWDKFFFYKKEVFEIICCTSYHVLCEKNYYTFAEENLDFFVVFKQFQYTLGCMPIKKNLESETFREEGEGGWNKKSYLTLQWHKN